MAKTKAKRKVYSAEFKADAVRLVLEDKRTVADVARSLGINESMLHQWKKAYQRDAGTVFPGRGRQTGVEAEMTQLKRDLARARQERDILKKALAYFARDPR